jgi:hypothetical protein
MGEEEVAREGGGMEWERDEPQEGKIVIVIGLAKGSGEGKGTLKVLQH